MASHFQTSGIKSTFTKQIWRKEKKFPLYLEIHNVNENNYFVGEMLLNDGE